MLIRGKEMSDPPFGGLLSWQSFLLFLYVASGTLQPILIEVLTYNGACEKRTFLFILPTYIGMTMSLLSNMDALKHGKIRWFKMILLAVMELCSAALCFTGLVCAGSAVFTVIYSSVTVYTAVFSRFFFGRQLHYLQWAGVFTVMLGLTSSSIGASFGVDEGEEDVGIGVIMIVIGSMFHSLVYILTESILKSEDPIAPEFLGSFMGCVGVAVFGLWQVFYTIPRFQYLILDEIDAHNGDMRVIGVTYFFLVVVNLVHGLCFYHLIKSVGSTTTGILKGVQSVAVFVISHFAFCSLQRSQCFTRSKGASLVVVVCGVTCYSIFKLETPEKLDVNHNDDFLNGSLQTSDSDSDRHYGSIDLSMRCHGNGNGNGNGSGIGNGKNNGNNGGSVRSSVSISQDSILNGFPNRAPTLQPDHSSLPRKNPRYHAIKNFEEARSKLIKSQVAVFDIGL